MLVMVSEWKQKLRVRERERKGFAAGGVVVGGGVKVGVGVGRDVREEGKEEEERGGR